jgi:3-phenylpropionate/trans-cinnamate dioxygenase ferredoxin reductase component
MERLQVNSAAAPTRVIIVGAGLAGLRAGEAIRESGFEGTLTIVGAEVHPPYNRPPLSKHILAGAMEPETAIFRHAVDAEWRLGIEATALDAEAHELTLGDGTTLAYDRLVIATGCAARPWHLDLPTAHGIMSLRDLDEALALRELVAFGPPVLIVGAGFVGCEVAATLRSLGLDVTLVDVAPHPMLPLGAEVGELMGSIHQENGVDLRLGVGVEEFEIQDGRLEAVRLTDGVRVPAGVALVATGAVPNSAWLRGSGVTLDPGIVCDSECFAVGVDDIVSAGDVAHWPHPLAGGELVRIEHWANSAKMAQTAGWNLMAPPEERREYTEVPSFWSDQYGLKIQSTGFPMLVDELEVVEGSLAERKFVAVGRRDGLMISALTLNSARRLLHYTAVLRDQIEDIAIGVPSQSQQEPAR